MKSLFSCAHVNVSLLNSSVNSTATTDDNFAACAQSPLPTPRIPEISSSQKVRPEISGNSLHLTLDYFSSGNLFQDRHRSALLCTCRTKLSIRHFISHPAIYCRFQNLFSTPQFISASKIYFVPSNLFLLLNVIVT